MSEDKKQQAMPDYLIEKMLLGELPPGIHKEDYNVPLTEKRAEEIKKSNDEILSKYKPEEMSKAIINRHKSQPTSSRSQQRRNDPFFAKVLKPALIPTLAALLIALIFALPFKFNFTGISSGDDAIEIRTKGLGPQLRIYRDSQAVSTRLENLDVAREGDILQIGYVAGDKKYRMILSVDGRGMVSLHYPSSEEDAPILKANGEILLPYSYTLDDAPAFERFFFLTSDSEFAVYEILEQYRKKGEVIAGGKENVVDLPQTIDVLSFELKKE